jgi:hypothetical protein
MNYRNETIRELLRFGQEFPDYTLGELLFSVLQPVSLHNGKGSLSWITNIPDEQFFTFVEKAREVEKEDTPTLDEVEIVTILRFTNGN